MSFFFGDQQLAFATIVAILGDKYGSVYLGNLELDNGTYLNKQLFVVKEYDQQIPLSYHFVNKNSLKDKKEDYLII